jgi:outer membrane protein assembly factor BamB
MLRPFRRAIATLSLAIAPLLDAAVAHADDWPQWQGPNRDAKSAETGLRKTWPEGGPTRVWLFEDSGLGYSAPSVVGNRLYTMGARNDEEQLIALDATTGKELWHAPIGKMLENNWGNGPRSAPTVDGELIYVLGAQGNLVCVQAAAGQVLWTRAMQDFAGEVPTWGYSESPLVVGDKVLCTPGGDNGAIIALDKNSGKEVWQMKDVTSDAHYSSMVNSDRGAGPECVQLLVDQVVGFNPEDGKVLWTHPWPGKVAVIPTPVVRKNLVYVTTGYNVGSMLLDIADDNTVKKIYDNQIMKNKHGGVVLLGDHIYGHSEGVGWLCQDLMTGERIWREREALEMGSVTYADGRLYCLGEDGGDAVLVEPSTEGWKEHGRFKLTPQTELRKPAGKIWTHPVVANGKLYLRDQNLLFCFDIAEGPKTAQR